MMQCSTLSLIWTNLSGHSLLPYQQIPEPNMPHNVSFNQQGYPGPHSPYQQQAPTSPHSPSLPSPPPPMHLRHDLPPGSPHYSIGSNGLSSSPPQGPHSPHSLSPDTPPPAYSPRLDLSGRRRSFVPLLMLSNISTIATRDIDTDRPPPEPSTGMETDNNSSAEAVPYQVLVL